MGFFSQLPVKLGGSREPLQDTQGEEAPQLRFGAQVCLAQGPERHLLPPGGFARNML